MVAQLKRQPKQIWSTQTGCSAPHRAYVHVFVRALHQHIPFPHKLSSVQRHDLCMQTSISYTAQAHTGRVNTLATRAFMALLILLPPSRSSMRPVLLTKVVVKAVAVMAVSPQRKRLSATSPTSACEKSMEYVHACTYH